MTTKILIFCSTVLLTGSTTMAIQTAEDLKVYDEVFPQRQRFVLVCEDKKANKTVVVKEMLPEDYKEAKYLLINYNQNQFDGHMFYKDGTITRNSEGKVTQVELRSYDQWEKERWALDTDSGKITLEGSWTKWMSEKFSSDLTSLRCNN